MYTPFFPHVLDAWNKRHLPNFHFVFYEDLKSNLRGEIEKMAKFLGKELSEEQLDRLREHLVFDSIEKNDAVNNEGLRKIGVLNNDAGKFMRKGMNYLTIEEHEMCIIVYLSVIHCRQSWRLEESF